MQLKMLKRRPNEGGTGIHCRKDQVICLVESQMVIFNFEEPEDWNQACCHSNIKCVPSGIFCRVQHPCQVSIALLHYWWRYS